MCYTPGAIRVVYLSLCIFRLHIGWCRRYAHGSRSGFVHLSCPDPDWSVKVPAILWLIFAIYTNYMCCLSCLVIMSTWVDERGAWCHCIHNEILFLLLLIFWSGIIWCFVVLCDNKVILILTLYWPVFIFLNKLQIDDRVKKKRTISHARDL